MKKYVFILSMSMLMVFRFATLANATLWDRGGGLIYDDVLNITWLQDANYAKTSGYDSDGKMTWEDANSWAAGLNFNSISGWRLPLVNGPPDSGSSYVGGSLGYNVLTTSGSPPYPAVTVYSEMASMFYDTLGNKAQFDTSGNTQAGYGLTNSGPFKNLMSDGYWTGTFFDTIWARDLWFSSGDQGVSPIWDNLYAWAVHDGDVAALLTSNRMVTDIDPPGLNPAYWMGDDQNNTGQLLNADPKTEEAWLEALLGKNYDDPSVNPIYRILKGTGGLGLDDKSLTDFDPGFLWAYAVVKYDGMWIAYESNGINNLLTTDTFDWGISHITFFGPTLVPEPAAMLLLGLGLLGLVGVRRRFKK